MIKIFALLFCVCVCMSCALDELPDESAGFNAEAIKEQRAEKDKTFLDADQSPLPEHARESFKGLKYFEPSEEYVVEATLKPSAKADTIRIQTSTSEIRAMLKYGKLTFTLKGKPYSLWAYTSLNAEVEELFVPFTDRTNGNSTYEAGRYISLDLQENDNEYVLDFNDAYNPYCAYNHNYSCPLVPKENNIPLEIEAGEQLWR